MRKMAVRLGVFVVGVGVVVGGVPSIALAQMAAAPATLRVTVTQVKADMLDEWLDLQKNEVVPALKKGGVKTRTVYSSGLFGTAGEYLSISPIDKFADFDNPNPQTRALGAPGAARLAAKLRKCIVSQHSYLITRMEDLGNTAPTPPNFIVSTRVRIPVGKITEFQNIVKTELTPIYKKANANFTVSQRGLGGNPSDITLSYGINKMAEMDGGSLLVKQLGQEGFLKLAAKITALGPVIEQVMRARVGDLSF
jgi:hypothetical protein